MMTRSNKRIFLAIFATISVLAVIFLIDVEKPARNFNIENTPGATNTDEFIPSNLSSPSDKIKVRWFVGLSTGTDPQQREVEKQIVESFNQSQEKIELVLEYAPYSTARTSLEEQIRNGTAPDIIGPIGIGVSNFFHDQWLNLTPLIENRSYDLSVFSQSAVDILKQENQLFGLPISVFPAILYYQKYMFDTAGLNYPPERIGDPYTWPDGTEEEWTWDVLAEVAKRLTLDANGLTPLDQRFDPQKIIQTGYHPLWSGPVYIGTFFEPGTPWFTTENGYNVQFPEAWVKAWYWWYDGMYGPEPFIADARLASDPGFGTGNIFNAQKTAMVITQLWYMCCVGDAGTQWDLAAIPSNQGFVSGRLDVDTLRIWKGTKNLEAAFEALIFLVGPRGASPLCLGTGNEPDGSYDALPALLTLQDNYFEKISTKFPHVKNWEIVSQSLQYPDIPSAESWMPSWFNAWSRLEAFGMRLQNDGTLNLETEIQSLQTDLQKILNE